MITDKEALLAAVVADLDNDLPRLVFADWLDEHAGTSPCVSCKGKGEVPSYTGMYQHGRDTCTSCKGEGLVSDGNAEWAELIRIQCELAVVETTCRCLKCAMKREESTCWPDPRECWELREREKAILCNSPYTFWENEWVTTDFNDAISYPPIKSVCPIVHHRLVVRRGFCDQVISPLPAWYGRRCQVCSGYGHATNKPDHSEMCRECYGLGRTPDSGPHILKKYSTIQSVTIWGCNPAQSHRAAYQRWMWYGPARGEPLESTFRVPARLPEGIWRRLPHTDWPSRAAALEALNQAAFTWAVSLPLR